MKLSWCDVRSAIGGFGRCLRVLTDVLKRIGCFVLVQCQNKMKWH